MRRAECPLCGNDKTDYEGTVQYIDLLNGMGDEIYNQRIRTCPKCNMAWTENTMNIEDLNNYYKFLSKYESIDVAMETDYSAQAMFIRQKEFIDKYIPVYSSVLEIGAATGANLNLYKENGKKTVGIEPSSNNKRYAKEKYGIKLYDVTLDEYFAEYGCTEQFDVVFISHVLEHIVNFVEFIEKAAALSKKYIFIELPVLEKIEEEEAPFAAFTNEHVNYFSIPSLKMLMEKCGCSSIKISIAENEGGVLPGYPTLVSLWEVKKSDTDRVSFEYTAGKIIQNYFKSNTEKVKRIQTVINTITDKEKLAVWGTGEHTSKLLAMTDLPSKNIIKFYDSDRKKRKMTMLGRQIQPFDPRDLENGEIETILISTYSSEKSISKYINEQRISRKFRVIKLYS